LLLAIGDVTGHGPPAAVVAASARGAFAALVQRGVEPSPARLLTSLDRAVRGIARGGWLMTCFAALIEPRAGAVQFANAGHPQPYILPAAGGLFVPTVRGTPLGEDKLRFEEGCASVHPGDVLVFRTDGLEDAVSGSGERFGVRRIRRSLLSLGQAPGSAVEVRDTILRTLAQHMGGTPPPDDQTLVVCRVRDALPAPVIA
jgi:sigma-B regulation protein RsbU (phosphoserine phosphatase)